MLRCERPPIGRVTIRLVAHWAWVALPMAIWALEAGLTNAQVRPGRSDPSHPAAESEPTEADSAAHASAGAEGTRTIECV